MKSVGRPDTVTTLSQGSVIVEHSIVSRISRVRFGVIAVVAMGCSADRPTMPASQATLLVALGRMLFSDGALSADGRVACATCHRPELAYTDGRSLAVGVGGRSGTRNAPSLVDVGRQHRLLWDGRRTRLEEQALDPLLNEVEHGLTGEAQLVDRLRAAPGYRTAFVNAFAEDGSTGEPITAQHVGLALAAFERTLVSVPSAFDRFQAGDKAALSEAARRGWLIFDQQAHCTRCHLATSDDAQLPLFTDHQFHSLSVGFAKIERDLPQLTERVVELRRVDQPLGRAVLLDSQLAELGRFAVTLDPHDLAAFKTPGLRNVARTGPYMHDGSVARLDDAVDLEVYSRGARDARPLILTPSERSDVVAFLEALSDDRIDPAVQRE